jgi:hypothetical protein
MVQVTISKLRMLVIEVQLALGGDMHHHLAGNQAGFGSHDVPHQAKITKRLADLGTISTFILFDDGDVSKGLYRVLVLSSTKEPLS